MDNKIINLFGNENINQDIKYSKLLEQFIEPFAKDFTKVTYYEEIFDFAINAWNFGNMRSLLPKEEMEGMINSLSRAKVDVDLLKRMIYSKVKNFKDYDRFIIDFEVKNAESAPVLSVLTQEQEAYLSSTAEIMGDEFKQGNYSEEDFEENYINRKGITLKVLPPLLDWFSSLHPEGFDEINKAKTYLISETIEDMEAWLRKKFDKLFVLELEELHSNKKEWPQNRNYKMFRQWFQVEFSDALYDLEREPIIKF